MVEQSRKDVWTYASANSVITPGNLAGTYKPGMRVALKQSTIKFFVIVSATYSSPNTTIVLDGMGVYSLTNAAITAHIDTPEIAPKGFPLALASQSLAGFCPATGSPAGLYLKDDMTWGAPDGTNRHDHPELKLLGVINCYKSDGMYYAKYANTLLTFSSSANPSVVLQAANDAGEALGGALITIYGAFSGVDTPVTVNGKNKFVGFGTAISSISGSANPIFLVEFDVSPASIGGSYLFEDLTFVPSANGISCIEYGYGNTGTPGLCNVRFDMTGRNNATVGILFSGMVNCIFIDRCEFIGTAGSYTSGNGIYCAIATDSTHYGPMGVTISRCVFNGLYRGISFNNQGATQYMASIYVYDSLFTGCERGCNLLNINDFKVMRCIMDSTLTCIYIDGGWVGEISDNWLFGGSYDAEQQGGTAGGNCIRIIDTTYNVGDIRMSGNSYGMYDISEGMVYLTKFNNTTLVENISSFNDSYYQGAYGFYVDSNVITRPSSIKVVCGFFHPGVTTAITIMKSDYVTIALNDLHGNATKIVTTGSSPIINLNDGVPDDGWVSSGETWTYAAADATVKTWTFTISGDLTAKYSKGMKIKLTQSTGGVKYFLISKTPTYGSPNTTITIYGGTDYVLENETISSPFYSMMKSPPGFPLSSSKWAFVISSSTDRTQLTPVSGTIYNPGGESYSIPAGDWFIQSTFSDIEVVQTNRGYLYATFMLSLGSDGTNPIYQNSPYSGYDISLWSASDSPYYSDGIVEFTAKTTVYYCFQATFGGDGAPSISLTTYDREFTFRCALL
jgi:hypothetical protein